VRRAVATKQRFAWNWLGGDLLTEVVGRDSRGWHELPARRVQPVCWSRPQDFLVERDDSEHEQARDADAWAYMLSNVELSKRFPNAGADGLLRARSFFRYLLRCSLGGEDIRPRLAREGSAVIAAQVFRQHHCESISGTGSSLQQTGELRQRLPLLLQHLGVRRLLDAPCGDFHWLRRVRLGDIEYIGADILSEEIAALNETCADGRRQFASADLLQDPLPKADAIFCRDLLPHLSFDEIAQLLSNFQRSAANYLLTTTFTEPRPNQDTADGNWRTLNLMLPPFSFPLPLCQLNEKCTEGGGAFADKSIGVWRLSDLPAGGG
jgi:hypothetical protein